MDIKRATMLTTVSAVVFYCRCTSCGIPFKNRYQLKFGKEFIFKINMIMRDPEEEFDISFDPFDEEEWDDFQGPF